VVNHPWQPYFLKAHVLVSPLLLFALGTIAVHHVWEHWVTGVRVSRRSAVLTALAVVPMVVTGYLIQVLTAQGWVRSMAIAHIVFGGLYGVGLALHTWIIRRRNGEAADRPPGGRAARSRRSPASPAPEDPAPGEPRAVDRRSEPSRRRAASASGRRDGG